MDPGLADAADHGCRVPVDRLDHAARQVRDLASSIAQRPSRVVQVIHTADADFSKLPKLRRTVIGRKNMRLRSWLGVMLMSAALAVNAGAWAQSYTDRPVRMLIDLLGDGTVDTV